MLGFLVCPSSFNTSFPRFQPKILTPSLVLLFKQTEQPRVYKGNIAVSVATAASVGGLFAILFLSKRDEKRKRDAILDSEPSPLATLPGTPEDIETKSVDFPGEPQTKRT